MRPSFAVEESLLALGHNMKVARLKRRLPQNVLAERAGVSLSTLCKIENGNGGRSDPLSLALETETLPKRIRKSAK